MEIGKYLYKFGF